MTGSNGCSLCLLRVVPSCAFCILLSRRGNLLRLTEASSASKLQMLWMESMTQTPANMLQMPLCIPALGNMQGTLAMRAAEVHWTASFQSRGA